ncbi:MAG TPA: hypothetical protein VK360_03045, partial [Acidimicrobiales bacterium]|nr:hypothetical protein [Acidimicrobiales bacterium]
MIRKIILAVAALVVVVVVAAAAVIAGDSSGGDLAQRDAGRDAERDADDSSATTTATTAELSTGSARPGGTGVGDPYFPEAGNGGYDVERYVLDLTWDPADEHLEGVTTITATATQPLSSFALDLVGLDV